MASSLVGALQGPQLLRSLHFSSKSCTQVHESFSFRRFFPNKPILALRPAQQFISSGIREKLCCRRSLGLADFSTGPVQSGFHGRNESLVGRGRSIIVAGKKKEKEADMSEASDGTNIAEGSPAGPSGDEGAASVGASEAGLADTDAERVKTKKSEKEEKSGKEKMGKSKGEGKGKGEKKKEKKKQAATPSGQDGGLASSSSSSASDSDEESYYPFGDYDSEQSGGSDGELIWGTSLLEEEESLTARAKGSAAQGEQEELDSEGEGRWEEEEDEKGGSDDAGVELEEGEEEGYYEGGGGEDDDNLWGDFDEEQQEPQAGDGGEGGGVVVGGAPWGQVAVQMAQDVLKLERFGGQLALFAVKINPASKLVSVRLDKLNDQYGSPMLDEIEDFAREFDALLEQGGPASKGVPADVSLEVSSPGAERVLRIPDELERFQALPMYVRYTEAAAPSGSSSEKPNGGETERDEVLELVSVDSELQIATWRVANVRLNREEAGKGRGALTSRQKKRKIELPFSLLKLVRLYLDI